MSLYYFLHCMKYYVSERKQYNIFFRILYYFICNFKREIYIIQKKISRFSFFILYIYFTFYYANCTKKQRHYVKDKLS